MHACAIEFAQIITTMVMGPSGVRRDDDAGATASRPPAPLALALPLAGLFVGAVAAVGAAGDGAEHAVMAGIVAGDAADHGAFQAAFGGGGGCGGERGDGDGAAARVFMTAGSGRMSRA